MQEGLNKYLEYKLQEFAQKNIDPLKQNVENAYGNLYDRSDEIAFQTRYGSDKRFEKYIPKMEELRQRELSRGNFVSREDALRLAFFEEEGRKPPEPAKPAATPEWDPVLNNYVHPGTKEVWVPGTPVKDAQAPAQPQTAQPPQAPPQQNQWPQQPPQAPQVPPQQPPQQPQFDGNYNGVDPTANPYQQNFSLPNQDINQPFAQNHSTKPTTLSDNPSEAELEAFEKSYGEVGF